MSKAMPLHEYCGDAADLFATLYDLVPDSFFLDHTTHDLIAEKDFSERVKHLSEIQSSTGRLDSAALDSAVRTKDWSQLLVALHALDLVLADFITGRAKLHGSGVLPALVRYKETGRLNSARVPGALLPRMTYPGLPISQGAKTTWFHSVIRVPPAVWNLRSVRFERINVLQDIDPPCGSTIRVGVAPLLSSLDEDMHLKVGPTPFRHPYTGRQLQGYRLRPRDHAGLRERIFRVLAALDTGGAVIGMFPEACLSDSLLMYWRELLKETAQDRINAGSRLRWILVGTGPVGGASPPHNRAVVLDRWGETIFTQDKLCDFALSADQVKEWRLIESWEPKSDPIVEDITRGAVLNIRESNIGRVAILICHDVAAPLDYGKEMRHFGVSHLFVPMFGKPIGNYGFPRPEAEVYVWHIGTWVLAVNSIVIARAQKRSGPVNACVLLGPLDDRTEWKNSIELPKGFTGPAQVEFLDLPVAAPGRPRH